MKASEIVTFMKWGKQFLRDLHVDLGNPGGGFKKARKALLEALKEHIEQNNPGIMYDLVFVDEVQDFWKDELEVLNRLLKNY